MGSYAECWLSTFYVGATKNDIDPSLMTLFRSSDKKFITGKKEKLPTQLRRWMQYIEDSEEVSLVYYSTPVDLIRDRLNLGGYTFETSKLAFVRYLEGEILQYEDWSNRKNGSVFLPLLKTLRSITVDDWLSALRTIYDKGLVEHKGGEGQSNAPNPLIAYMLERDWYGFPGPDLNIALRLAIEILPETDEFIYDITDLVLSGYFSIDDDLVEYALDLSSDDYYSNGKIIVLTEGRTDSWILSNSLELLYPHLSGYFSFMDFDSAKVGGGVGNLANIVKAFCGAGIVNKVIALFDNDTAAIAALRGLQRVSIPKNVKVLMLPDFDMLNDYPTLGPSGLVNMNINGMAGSIELYLGNDVLQDSHGNCYPIQWTGYNSEVRKYQGEILSKDKIQKDFNKRLESCKLDKNLVEKMDWTGIRAILNTLFTAFHDVDQKEIISCADEYYDSQ